MKAIYFLSVVWVILAGCIASFDPLVTTIFGSPGILGLFVVYLKTGRFLLPPR